MFSRNFYTDWYFYNKLVKEIKSRNRSQFFEKPLLTVWGIPFFKKPRKTILSKEWKKTIMQRTSLAWIHIFYTISFFLSGTLREKCPNSEFFLVRIFPYSDWIRGDTKYLSVFSPNAAKYGPEKTPYLDTFHAVVIIMCQEKRSKPLWNKNWSLFNERLASKNHALHQNT